MLRCFYGPSLVVVFSLMLASCAGVDDKAQDFQAPVEGAGMQKFPAWKQEKPTPGSKGVNKAAQELMQQADTLIARNQIEQASEKLERLLRIEPAYARAWSRLAWIALENNRPGRTRQMAQRSNSYAYDDKRLKALNWSFIRQAEKMVESHDDSMGGR